MSYHAYSAYLNASLELPYDRVVTSLVTFHMYYWK